MTEVGDWDSHVQHMVANPAVSTQWSKSSNPPLSGLAAQHVRLLLTECGQQLPPLTIGQTPLAKLPC